MVRSFFRVSRAAVLWALPALLTIPPARAQSYTITDLGTLGGASSQAHGVNGSGEIVGQALTASGDDHAFRYSAGVMSDLNVRGSISVARAINASGQIAGYYYSKSYQAFLLTNGKLQDLGNLGGNYSAAYGISVLGHVCGSSYTRKNQEHAFLWKGGKMIDLEQELYDKGFQSDDEEKAGDFSEEGWASFKWRAKIVAPKTQGMSPQRSKM